jgi:hypothetical protein
MAAADKGNGKGKSKTVGTHAWCPPQGCEHDAHDEQDTPTQGSIFEKAPS